MDKLFKANFYPGPSRLYDEVADYASDAFKKGILSINHRSPVFEDLFRLTKERLFTYLNVPKDYHLVFTSSATECWEIISQSLVEDSSFHLYNGNFGKKWFEYAGKINQNTESAYFSPNTLIRPEDLNVPLDSEWICVTQNETSNGTQVHNETIAAIRKAFPDQFIAVDATSSMAGVDLNFTDADLWFASVQKCFGLPAGLGIMIFSDAVVKKSQSVSESNHYNSFANFIYNEKKNQTHITPNVMGIYLLFRLFDKLESIKEVDKKITERAKHLYSYFQGYSEFQPITQNHHCYSSTVLAFEGEPGFINDLKKAASQHGIILGNGYGDWKNTSFRIANFPAIPDSEVEQLIAFFDQY
ncbi:MAG: alanine--glyoxylate aminotransferase family protein [Opitutaceae bacterium]|nr:alanine--glyoxylate aminotransferase family protein [Cytophagales bacterium]